MDADPEAAFLALDVGNSAVKGGLFVGDELARIFHVEVNLSEPSSEAAGDAWIRALRPHLADADISDIGLASVVPEAIPVAEQAVRTLTGADVVTVDADMPLPFEMAYDTPQTLGADRLAAAAAAWVRHRGPASERRSVVAVDAGTAVTYDVVDAGGTYRGGAIAAGPVLMQRALRSGTAQLPTVPLVFPDQVIGRSTRDAMQSGIMWGFVDGVRGMLDRLASTLDDPPVVLLTGGWSPILADHLDGVDDIVPHLVLDGVRILVQGSRENRPA